MVGLIERLRLPMTATVKRDATVGSVSFIIGAIIPGLISLNIFARSEQLASLETQLYKNFVQKQELDTRLDKLETKLDTLQVTLMQISRDLTYRESRRGMPNE